MKTLVCVLIVLFLPVALRGQGKLPVNSPTRVLTTKDLTNEADVVALGKVAAMTSAWNAGRARIYTRVRIDVSEFLKGSAGGQPFTVVTAGGEVGDVGELYSGVSRFRRQEEVIVFARKTAGEDHEVIEGTRGRVPVTTDPATGVKTLPGGMQLDDFRSDIVAAVKAASHEEKKP